MSDPIVELGWVEVVLLLGMALVSVLLSLLLHLGIARELGVATLRSVVQLIGVGLVIGWVFAQADWYSVLALLFLMTLIAGITAARRSGVRMKRLSILMTVVLAAATAVTLFYLSFVVVGVRNWSPRYLIPMGGMLLGNGMTAATLAVERMVSDLKRNAGRVEVLLSMGATPRQAADEVRRSAIRAGMMPTINTMLIVGIITLPGMMTGQMLGGTAPLQAALYQFLILIGLAFVASLSGSAVVLLLLGRMFTPAWQLDKEALKAATKK